LLVHLYTRDKTGQHTYTFANSRTCDKVHTSQDMLSCRITVCMWLLSVQNCLYARDCTLYVPLQAVGRSALHLLEDLTGQYNYNLGNLQALGEDEPQDFDSFFALYGARPSRRQLDR